MIKKSSMASSAYKRIVHHSDAIMAAMTSQITGVSIVYLTIWSDAYQWKHQSSASLAFVRGIHRWPVNSPHKWPVTRKMFPFDDVIILEGIGWLMCVHLNEEHWGVTVIMWGAIYRGRADDMTWRPSATPRTDRHSSIKMMRDQILPGMSR